MASDTRSGATADLPRLIGGYRVLGEAGRSRLGPVVRARDTATGRDVALTVLRSEWACLHGYVAHLVRDAYAATAVVHPNLVRLLDVGEARGRFFFVNEHVEGQDLADRVAKQGPLAPREAVTHLLQAARGLRAAHAQGVTHGDLSAESLVANVDGRTMVAGLGMVETPESLAAAAAREASAPIPLGAQPENAATLSAVRADVRGLGATLVHLVSGRPLDASRSGADAAGLVARGVPANLVELARRLLDALPGTGYTEMGQVIAVFEQVLAAKKPAALAPGEDETTTLQNDVAAFLAAPTARLQTQLLFWGLVVCAFFALIGLALRQPGLALSFVGLGLMTALARLAIKGRSGTSDVFPELRGLVLEGRALDWLMGAAGLAIVVIALVVFRLHWAWLAFGVLAVLMAYGMHLYVDRKVDEERHEVTEEARALVRALRVRGVSEEAVRAFVRSTALPDWEEFFESLFGYHAKLAAREPSERGWRGLLRKRYGPARDVFLPWVERVRASRRKERDQAFLQSVEVRALVGAGVNLLTARRKSRRIAEAMVAVATEARAAATRPHAEPATTASGEPVMAAAIRRAAEAPEQALVERERGLIGERTWWLVEALVGPRVRFLLGAAMLAGFLVWAHQNGIYSGEQIKQEVTRVVESPDVLKSLPDVKIDVNLHAGATKPLETTLLPPWIARLFQGFNPGVAGLLLVLSAFFHRSWADGAFILGSLIVLVGPSLGIHAVGPLDAERASIVAGVLVAALAFLWRVDD